MSRVVHFEIHAKDMDKIQKFYEDVFGWSFKDQGAQYGGYRIISTGTDGPGINGGLNPRQGELPQSGQAVNAFVNIMGVENIDETLAKIEPAGGTMAMEKMDVPAVGQLAYCKDPEGNLFGILQPAPDGM